MTTTEVDELSEVPVVPATFRQLGILVLDGSVSMQNLVDSSPSEAMAPRTKADEVNLACREMLSRFKASRKAANFSFAVVTFNDSVTSRKDAVSAVDIDDNANYDPTEHGVGGTIIASGLEAAGEIAQKYLTSGVDGLPASVVVLLMTDGECSQSQRTIAAAGQLKQDPRVEIAAAYFATKGGGTGKGPDLLKAACSDPVRMYKTVYDAETLRNFFVSSMTSAAARAGIEVTEQ